MIHDFILNNIELKPGMVLITEDKETYIVFPRYDELYLMQFGGTDWHNLPWEDVTDKVIIIKKSAGDKNIVKGETIWYKSIEISMSEIAKKFNIPVECIKIKK